MNYPKIINEQNMTQENLPGNDSDNDEHKIKAHIKPTYTKMVYFFLNISLYYLYTILFFEWLMLQCYNQMT